MAPVQLALCFGLGLLDTGAGAGAGANAGVASRTEHLQTVSASSEG